MAGRHLTIADVLSAVVSTQETTTSTSYADLATVGPAVTATIGSSGTALVIITVEIQNSDSAARYNNVGFAVSGSTSVAAADSASLGFRSVGVAFQIVNLSHVEVASGLTPGSNTFTLKYKTDGGTFYAAHRRLIVIPL